MSENKKLTALIFGSTGLTGRFVQEFLLKDERYEQVVIFVRKELKTYHGKIRQVVFNPQNLDETANLIQGDHLFCCLGTTMKKAGSREAFLDVDLRLVVRIAESARSNGVKVFSVVSSVGAHPESANFYLKTKGQMESALRKLNFNQLVILRPSMLLGLRHESRWLEDAGKSIFKVIAGLMIGKLRKYRPIHAEIVAKAMIAYANEDRNLIVAVSDEIQSTGSAHYNNQQ